MCRRCGKTGSDFVRLFVPGKAFRAVRSAQKNIGTVGPLSIQGEGWGEGEHKAVVVIPFTLRALLLCYHRTCERVKEAHRRLLNNPGSLNLLCGVNVAPPLSPR